jgi:hypothetical protein
MITDVEDSLHMIIVVEDMPQVLVVLWMIKYYLPSGYVGCYHFNRRCTRCVFLFLGILKTYVVLDLGFSINAFIFILLLK